MLGEQPVRDAREAETLGDRVPGGGEETPLEIPYAVRWLVPKGERFANFDILNDNDTQLAYERRFGHIYAVGVPTKKWRLVMVSDPELLDEVAADEEQFGKRVEEINFFEQLGHSRGAGISVIGDGEHYERVRRVMLPWYAPSHQRTQLERMKEQARKLVAAWSELPDDAPLDARTWMERYTLEVSGRGACNYDFGLLNGDAADAACPHAFAAAVPESTKESILRVAEPRPDFTLFAGRARRARTKRYQRQKKELFRTADALVEARLHTQPLGQQTDLLSRLVSVPDPETGERLDAETVRDQILMHLSNGFNGPSITGAWLAYVLATHPDVEEKLLAEIDAITGGDPDYELRYDDLMALTYTTQVIKETLRIYPPMPVTIRRSLKDGMLGRYRIRKGDIILVGALAAHRDPRYWGPNADEFDPEQFAMEKVVERPRHAFIPFSIGKRQCMAQEVTFMMLRVVLFEIYRRYRLQLAPGASVAKNTVVTTKPAAVPIVRVRRAQPEPLLRDRPPSKAAGVRAGSRDWGTPTEIPQTSAYGRLVIGYGSLFGANKELADRFAERGRFHGYTSEVLTLNELAASPPRAEPWLLVVMTSTYTSNPPTNANAFKSLLEQSAPGGETWRNCRYLVWGLGNSQWNAFLAFPRWVHARLAELGATPLANFAFGDVGSPVWEGVHAQWNRDVWPALLELSGARASDAAAARLAAEQSAERALTGAQSNEAMTRSLGDAAPRVMLVPTTPTNAAGIETVEARVVARRELQAPRVGAPDAAPRARAAGRAHVHGRRPPRSLPAERRGARRVARPAPRRRGRRPLHGAEDDERPRRAEGRRPPGAQRAHEPRRHHGRSVSGPPRAPAREGRPRRPSGHGSREIGAEPAAAGYDALRLLEELPSCTLNIFEFLQVSAPLRPRYYSPSSSPRVHGGGVAHLTVALDSVGMCSHYLHGLHEGERVDVFLDSADGFHLQEDVARPMIFVSAGTGFAPMRAFLWERRALMRAGVALSEAALFNGIRSRSLDHIYRDEIEQFAADGVVDHVHLATSRERPGDREYVQDRIREQSALVWRLLAAGGYVYVCGSQPMRDGVRAAFVDVVAEHGALPREHAEAYLLELETVENRYRPDLWG